MPKKKQTPKFDHEKRIREAIEWLDYNVLSLHSQELLTPQHIIMWEATVGWEKPGATDGEMQHREFRGTYTVHMAAIERRIKISVITSIGLDGHTFAQEIDQALSWCGRYLFKEPMRNKLHELAFRDALNQAALAKVQKGGFDEWYQKFVSYKDNKDQFYAHVDIETGERPMKRLRHKSKRNMSGKRVGL